MTRLSNNNDDVKDQNTRVQEAINLYKQLYDLGISEAVCPGVKDFKAILNDFVKNGQSLSGKIKLPEINRQIVYILTMQPHIISSVSLKHYVSSQV